VTDALVRAAVTTWLVARGGTRLAVALASNSVRRRESAAGIAARTLARTLEQLGPTYVKLGQILGTRRDLLSPDVVVHLERLQDRLEPASFDIVPRLFRDELGLELDDVFAELDPIPIASASIACVYRGVLHDGTEVAVKVRRPGIAELVQADLRLIRGGARLLARLPGLRGLPMLSALDEFGACLLRQIDLRLEATANSRIRAALADEPEALLPTLIDGYCSESVLTMSYLPLQSAGRDASRRPALLVALRALYRMIFVDGFVHCDLHGANMFLLADGRAALLDFGFVAELPPSARIGFAEFFLAMASNDGKRCAQITVDTAASVPEDLDHASFEAEVCALVTRAAGASVDEFRVADFVLGLFDIQRRYRIVGTTAFTMAIVSLLVFEGTAKDVASDLDFGQEAIPFVLRALAGRLTPARATSRSPAFAEADARLVLTGFRS
jgi:ubiquinone biosynthesis protein